MEQIFGVRSLPAQNAEDGLDEERRRDQLPVEKVSQGIEMPDIIAFKLETSAMPLAERLEDILDILECIAENPVPRGLQIRSEEHTSELQSLMRNSYAVFCFKKNTHKKHT